MFVFCEIACSTIIFSGAIGEKCKFLGVKPFLEIYFSDKTCIPVCFAIVLAPTSVNLLGEEGQPNDKNKHTL